MEIKIEVEEECWHCYGSGRALDANYRKTSEKCVPCNGTGQRPTEIGYKILELVEKHLLKKEES